MSIIKQFRPYIEKAAATHGLDPDLVEAIVLQESAGRWFAYRYEPAFFNRYLAKNPLYAKRDPREVSASYGLCQVMFTTAIENGFVGQPWDLFRPEVALDLGCRHFAGLLKWARQYGRDEKTTIASALAAYNGGKQGNIADDMQDRNAHYAQSVLSHYRKVKESR